MAAVVAAGLSTCQCGLMSRRVVWVVVAAALTGLLFATVSTSGGVQMWGEPTWEPTPLERDPIEVEVETEEPPPIADESDNEPIKLPAWVGEVMQVLLITAAFAATVALLWAGWRNRPRLRWRRPGGADDFEVLPDIAAAVVERAAAQRAALLDGAPRNAIVRCWLQLEADVAAVGLARDPADTSLEFTERVLARYTVDPEAITELAALFREARFSDHQLDETHRRAALDALDRLHHALGDSAISADT